MSTPLNSDHVNFNEYYYSRDLKKWNKNTKYCKNKYFTYGFGIPGENTDSFKGYYDKGFVSCFQKVIRNGIEFELETESFVINATDIQDNILSKKRYVLMRYLIRKTNTDKWYNMTLVKKPVENDIGYVKNGNNGDIYYYLANYPDSEDSSFIVTDTARLYGINWLTQEEVMKSQRDYFNNEYFESEEYDIFLNNYNELSKIIKEDEYKATNGNIYDYRIRLEQDEFFLDKKKYTIEWALKGTDNFSVWNMDKFTYKDPLPFNTNKKVDVKGKFNWKEEDLDLYSYLKGSRIIDNKVLSNNNFPFNHTTSFNMSDILPLQSDMVKGHTTDIGKKEVNNKIGYNGIVPITYHKKKSLNQIDYKEVVDDSIDRIKDIIDDKLDEYESLPFEYRRKSTLDTIDREDDIERIKKVIDYKLDNHSKVPFSYTDSTFRKGYKRYSKEEMNEYLKTIFGKTITGTTFSTSMTKLLNEDTYDIEKEEKRIVKVVERDMNKDLTIPGSYHLYTRFDRFLNEDSEYCIRSYTNIVERVIDEGINSGYINLKKDKCNLNYNKVVRDSLDYIKNIIRICTTDDIVPFTTHLKTDMETIYRSDRDKYLENAIKIVKKRIDARVDNESTVRSYGNFSMNQSKRKERTVELERIPSSYVSSISLHDLLVGNEDIFKDAKAIIDRSFDEENKILGKHHFYCSSRELIEDNYPDKYLERIHKSVEKEIMRRVYDPKCRIIMKSKFKLDYTKLVKDTISYAKWIIDNGKDRLVPFSYKTTLTTNDLLTKNVNFNIYQAHVQVMIDERMNRSIPLPVNFKVSSPIFKMNINYNGLVKDTIRKAEYMIDNGRCELGKINKRFNVSMNDLLDKKVVLSNITSYMEKMIDKRVDNGKPLPYSFSTKDKFKFEYPGIKVVKDMIDTGKADTKSFKYHFFSDMDNIQNLSNSEESIKKIIDKRILSGKPIPYNGYEFNINELNYNDLKQFTITKAKEIIDSKLDGKVDVLYTKTTTMSIFEMIQNEYNRENLIKEIHSTIDRELTVDNSTVPFRGHMQTNMESLLSKQRNTYLDNVYKRIVKIVRRMQDKSLPAPLIYHVAYNKKPLVKPEKPKFISVDITSTRLQDLNRVIDSKMKFGFTLPYTYKTVANSMKVLLSKGKDKFVDKTMTDVAKVISRRLRMKQEIPNNIHTLTGMSKILLLGKEMTDTYTMNHIKRAINQQFGFSIPAPLTYNETTTLTNFFRTNKNEYNKNLIDRAIMKINSKFKLGNFTPFTYSSSRFGVEYMFEHGKDRLHTYAINTAKSIIHKKLDNKEIDQIAMSLVNKEMDAFYKYLNQQIESVYIPEIYQFKTHAINGIEYSVRVHCVESPMPGYTYPSIIFEANYGEGDNINQLFKRDTIFITPENYKDHRDILKEFRDKLAQECVDYLNTLIGPVDFADYAINETQYSTKSGKVFYLRYSYRKVSQDRYKADINIITEWSNKNYMFDNVYSTRRVTITSHEYFDYKGYLLLEAEKDRVKCVNEIFKPWDIDLPPTRKEERYINTGNKVYYLGVNFLQGYATDEANNIIVRCSYRKDGDNTVYVYSNSIFPVSSGNVNNFEELLNRFANEKVEVMKESLDIPNIIVPENVTIPVFTVNGFSFNLSVRYSKQDEINEVYTQAYIDGEIFGNSIKKTFMKDQTEADQVLASVANDLIDNMKDKLSYAPEDLLCRYSIGESVFLIETKYTKEANSHNVSIDTYVDNKLYMSESGTIKASNIMKSFSDSYIIATDRFDSMATVLKDVPVTHYMTLNVDDIHYNLLFEFTKESGVNDITYSLFCDDIQYYKGYMTLNANNITEDIKDGNNIFNNKKSDLITFLNQTTPRNKENDITYNNFIYNVKTLYHKYPNDHSVSVDVLVDGEKYATYSKNVRVDTIVSDFNNIENVVTQFKQSIDNIIKKSPENATTIYNANTFGYKINVAYFKNSKSNIIDTKIYVDNVAYSSRHDIFIIDKFDEILSTIDEWKSNQLDGLSTVLNDSPTNIEEEYRILDFVYNIKANYTKSSSSRSINTVILLDDEIKETFTTVINSGNLNQDLINFKREVRDQIDNLKANLKGLANEDEVYSVGDCKFHFLVNFTKNINNTITLISSIDGRSYKEQTVLPFDISEFSKYEEMGKQYIADMKALVDGLPKNVKEVYSINGFSFDLGIKLYKEPDDNWITMEPYEDGFLVVDLVRKFEINPLEDIRWMNDESMDMMIRLKNLFFRLPMNYTNIHEVGDMSFLVGATFNKSAGSELVCIQLTLDNEPYNEPYIMNLTLDNMDNGIADKAIELIDTLKAKLDTLPVTNIQTYTVKKFNFNVKTYYKKELRNDMVKVWMKVDDRDFDQTYIETFNINDFSNIIQAYQELIDKLDIKLNSIIPKDIHTTHTKNMTTYAIDVYFSKPINSNSMKIEYNVNNVTLSTTNALMKYN